MWNKVDKALINYYKKYKKEQQTLSDNLQSILDSIKYNKSSLYEYTKDSNLQRFKRVIIDNKDIFPKGSYLLFIANKYLNRMYLKNNEILEFLLIIEYLKFRYKTDETELFNELVNIGYEQALKECRSVKSKSSKVLDTPNIILLSLLSLPNHLGYVWSDYVTSMILFEADEVYRQTLINIEQERELNIENEEYKNILEKQIKRQINFNDGRFSGALENQSDFLINMTKVEVGKQYGLTMVRFVSTIDKKTTRMCKSLNNKIFYTDKLNVYKRFSQRDNAIITYRTKGLVLGENLPPITNHFHYCRSTITYQV